MTRYNEAFFTIVAIIKF